MNEQTQKSEGPLNYCGHGYLINDRSLSSDPADHDAWGLPKLGCNRLHCATCDTFLRSAPGLHPSATIREADRAALYQLADWATSPLLREQKGVRFYLCRCTHWLETYDERECDPDSDDATNMWSCGGHPLATLPHTFDGVPVSPENLADLVVRSLRGWTPPGAAAADKADKANVFWTGRLYCRLEKTPWHDAVAMAGLPLLEDPDSTTRSRAMLFFAWCRSPAGAERAARLLAGDRSLFAGVPHHLSPESDKPTLEEALWLLAGKLVREPRPARNLARSDALVARLAALKKAG